MAALTHVQVCDNVATVIAAGTSLVESPELLEVRNAPEANLNRAFCVVPRSISNTNEYRDSAGRRERGRYAIDLVCIWQCSVHNYNDTRDQALGDCLAAVEALCGDTSATVAQMTIYHNTTSFTVHASREWLFGTVSFTIDADVQL